MKKKELIFVAVVLFVAAAVWIGTRVMQGNEDYGSIEITINGELYGTYSLGEDQVIAINDTNVCEIKDKKAVMIEANCPDHLCMSQAPIDANGGFIICLPNFVFIEGIPSESSVQNGLAIDSAN